jgi:hypothetical protein
MALASNDKNVDVILTLLTTPYESSSSFTWKVGKEKVDVTPERVLFQGTTTIVFWSDNTKSIVKCNVVDNYDRETAVAFAVAHKMFGSKKKFQKFVAAGFEAMTVTEEQEREAEKARKKIAKEETSF